MLRILDTGVAGRPLLRYLALATVSGLLAVGVATPEIVFGRQPTVEAQLIAVAPRGLPEPLDVAFERLPPAVRGYTASFRLPSGEALRGPVSAAEYRLLRAGAKSLDVHVIGAPLSRARPASGVFGPIRLALAGLFAASCLAYGVAALVRIRRVWWMASLARHGVAVVGRLTEVNRRRLVRGERPTGELYELFYDFRADGTVREGSVSGFYSARHLPFEVKRPVRVLCSPRPNGRSIPLDLLPL